MTFRPWQPATATPFVAGEDYDPYDLETFGLDCIYPIWQPCKGELYPDGEITRLGEYACVLLKSFPSHHQDGVYDQTVIVQLVARHIPSRTSYTRIAVTEITSRYDLRGWNPEVHGVRVTRAIQAYKERLESHLTEYLL